MRPAIRPLFLILPLASALILSGCAVSPAANAFSQTFEGYPCGSKCDQFRSGFDTAQASHYTQNSDCQTLDSSSRVGCLSYIHEYRIAHNGQI